eukprot:211726-Chlamydomonas_euryale.AAC.1
MKRPWCPATRILEHRETERQEKEAAEKKAAAQKAGALDIGGGGGKPARRDGFPPLPADGERVWQKNEGEWDFSLDEDDAGRAVVLEGRETPVYAPAGPITAHLQGQAWARGVGRVWTGRECEKMPQRWQWTPRTAGPLTAYNAGWFARLWCPMAAMLAPLGCAEA